MFYSDKTMLCDSLVAVTRHLTTHLTKSTEVYRAKNIQIHGMECRMYIENKRLSKWMTNDEIMGISFPTVGWNVTDK